MLIDFRSYDGPDLLEADVCLIGAGAAGMALTRLLAARGYQVLLVEAGGLDFDADTQDLYAGANAGMPYYDLVDSRLRFFGGTTNIWGGRCMPLQPVDFDVRAWVPFSGWPMTYAELLPFYRRAQRALQVGDFEYGAELWKALKVQPPALMEHGFETWFWRFDEMRERFGASANADLLEHPAVRALTFANVTHIQAGPDADHVTQLVVQALSGRSATIRAGQYVLCCGGIENARLLLLSNDVETGGIGNRHDQVGRYFMEHPHGRGAVVASPRAYEIWATFRKRFLNPPVAPIVLASPQLQAQLGALNTGMTFKLQPPPGAGPSVVAETYQQLKHQLAPTRRNRRLWHLYRGARRLVQRSSLHRVQQFRARRGSVGLHVMIRGEQAPNPASRVTLGDARDALGGRRAVLDWRLSELDKHTVRSLMETLRGAFRQLDLGELSLADWLLEPGATWPVDPTVGNHPIAGYHHMGTTRMGRDPTTSVTDEHGRVHGYGNLHIAGSSLFPTGGWANPTLTILALAERLGDRLTEIMPRM